MTTVTLGSRLFFYSAANKLLLLPLSVKGKRLIHTWCNVTYLEQFIMRNGEKGDKPDHLEPWADDERLNDVFQKGTVIRDIKLINKLAETLEKSPIAPMLKIESIPLLWEKSKELKPKNFEDLIHTCHEHGSFKMSVEKLQEETLVRTQHVREDAEREKKARDKRSADEMSSSDEDERSPSKERKRTSSDMNTGIFNDEGTYANSNSQLHDIVVFVAHTCSLLLLWFKQLRILCLVSLLMHMSLRILLRTPIWICMSLIMPPCKIVDATHNCN